MWLPEPREGAPWGLAGAAAPGAGTQQRQQRGLTYPSSSALAFRSPASPSPTALLHSEAQWEAGKQGLP